MGAAVVEFFSGLWAAYKARRAAQAQADLQVGKDILDQAQREAAEMAAAQAKLDAARKELDASLSTTPTVPANAAPVAPTVPAPADAAPAPPVPGSAAAAPEDITARLRKP